MTSSAICEGCRITESEIREFVRWATRPGLRGSLLACLTVGAGSASAYYLESITRGGQRMARAVFRLAGQHETAPWRPARNGAALYADLAEMIERKTQELCNA